MSRKAVEIDDYTIAITDEFGHFDKYELWITGFGCDSGAQIESVDKAREVIGLIQQWMSLHARYGRAATDD